MSGGYLEKFKTCDHDWELHVDVEHCGGPASGNGIFLCKSCGTFVTMIEKSALEQTEAISKSLVIQEKHTQIGMFANVIASITLIVAFLTLLFGDTLMAFFKKS